MRALRVPALTAWRYEVCCTDDGTGVDRGTVDRRLGVLGELPEQRGNRGLFGRGLRDVWLAQGAGRIEGVRDGRAVESWFFPAAGDAPYAYLHVRDEAAPRAAAPFTRVTVPLAAERLPTDGRLRTLVAQLVQLRPVFEDPAREVWLELPSGAVEIVALPTPEPDPARPLLFDDEVEIRGDISARITVRRSAKPLSAGMSRATRLGGLVVRSGRAAQESTLGSHEGAPGTRHLFGEVRCDALEALQRDALDQPRPQVVVKVDRSGLNDNHPVVRALYDAVDKVLRPIAPRGTRGTSSAGRGAGGRPIVPACATFVRHGPSRRSRAAPEPECLPASSPARGEPGSHRAWRAGSRLGADSVNR